MHVGLICRITLGHMTFNIQSPFTWSCSFLLTPLLVLCPVTAWTPDLCPANSQDRAVRESLSHSLVDLFHLCQHVHLPS